MEKKYEQLTIMDAFVLSKVLLNQRLARHFMEKFTGLRIRHIVYPDKNIVERRDGTKGVYMELHLHNKERSVCSVQLFLCEKDLFRAGLSIYHFKNRCEEIPELTLDGGLHRIFICITEDPERGEPDDEVKAFLYYMKDASDKRTNHVKMLDSEVCRVKTNVQFRKEYEAIVREETEARQRAYAEAKRNANKKRPPVI